MNYNVPIQTGANNFARPVSSIGISGNGVGIAAVPGFPGVGITVPNTTGIDLDPITPGIQNTPGIVTATGPSRVVFPGNNYHNSFGSVDSTGFMIGGNLNSFPRAMGVINGPLSQLQCHSNRQIPPPQIPQPPLLIQNHIETQITTVPPFPTQVIQKQQTVIVSPPQAYIPPFNVPNQTSIIPLNDSHALQASGFQRQQALLQKRSCNLQWWAWVIIGLMLLGIILTTLYFVFRPKYGIIDDTDILHRGLAYDRALQTECLPGQTNVNGKCIQCPSGTIWNGRQCSPINGFYKPSLQPPYVPPQDIPPSYVSNSPYDPNSRFKRMQTINTSWNSGSRIGQDPSKGYSSGTSSKVINSVAEIKKIIVPPLVQDPINHLNRKS